jgi:hypothetical protein
MGDKEGKVPAFRLIRLVAVLCAIVSAVSTATFILAGLWVLWRAGRHDLEAALALLPAAGLALVATMVFACASQVLRLLVQMAQDVWHIRRAAQRGEEGGS